MELPDTLERGLTFWTSAPLKAGDLPDNHKIFSFELDSRLKSYNELSELTDETEFLAKVFFWKTRYTIELPPVICLIGGTGTGKSTIFNSIASMEISKVGVKRPCTMNAVILAHEKYGEALSKAPFSFDGKDREAELVLISNSEFKNVILVDTPDFDSVASDNRSVAHRFLVMSDIIFFVTSQEKYGDLACRKMLEEARVWGKRIRIVLNKVSSDVASADFLDFTKTQDSFGEPLIVTRLAGMPTRIPGFKDYPVVEGVFSTEAASSGGLKVKADEIERLRLMTVSALDQLGSSLSEEVERIAQVNHKINEIASQVSDNLNVRLDKIVSRDVEKRMRARLQSLLRKYDILFVPRLMLRNAFNSIIGYFSELIFSKKEPEDKSFDDKEIRFEDFSGIEAMAPLRPLDSAVSDLNLKLAELFSSNPSLTDLRLIALNDVERYDFRMIKKMYEDAFPGLENLLESEFEKIRDGLSRFDEVKLYGSYTLWALLLITFEIVIGGGLTLLDLLLNSVIVPFIPKWLLDLKILDLLKSIARKVDEEHRNSLKNILYKQAELYTECFSSLMPTEQALREIETIKLRVMQT